MHPALRHALSLTALAVLGPFALAFVLLVGFSVTETDVPDDALRSRHEMSPDMRLAIAISYRAGLIQRTSDKERELLDDARSSVGWPRNYIGPDWSRAHVNDCGTFAPTAEAIVAVERYLRPPARRAVEHNLAYFLHTVTGRYPDWSLGVAQIRPSTAQVIMTDALAWLSARHLLSAAGMPDPADFPRAAMVRMVQDACYAADLVNLAVTTHPGKTGSYALRHMGGRPVPTIPSVIDYARIVDRIATTVLPMASQNQLLITSGGELDRYDPAHPNDPLVLIPNVWHDFDGVCFSNAVLEALVADEPEVMTRLTMAPRPIDLLPPSDDPPMSLRYHLLTASERYSEITTKAQKEIRDLRRTWAEPVPFQFVPLSDDFAERYDFRDCMAFVDLD